MFICNHCGGCCEEVLTQIKLTFGDVHRLSKYLKKNSLELYKEKIIGIYPFANEDGKFDLEIGLNIPCKFRKQTKENDSNKICSIYEARPINCRIFPYWVLASENKELINDMKNNHLCGKAVRESNITSNDIESYRKYTKYLSDILDKENEITEKFMSKNAIKLLLNKFPIDEYRINDNDSLEEYRNKIKSIIKEISKFDFSFIFERLDEELRNQATHGLINFEDIKNLNEL